MKYIHTDRHMQNFDGTIALIDNVLSPTNK